MAIITDPDVLSRYDVVFNTASQVVSIYPVGDTQRSTTYTNVFVATTGDITTAGGNFATDSVVAGDVVAIQNGPDGGHYYVETAGATTDTIPLADIDTGTAGAEVTSLTVQQTTFDGADVTVGTDQITITTHGYVTGDAVVLRGTTLPSELTTNTVYYVIRIDANEIQLATTYANAVAGTQIDIITPNAGTGHTLDKRLIVGIFNNGANTSEAILGFATSGDGDGDVADGVTLQAVYSFAKEEWRVDSLETDLTVNYADDLIRHEFPFEAITSEQFEIGGGTSHDNWNWFNSYTRKKVRTAGWAEKTRTGTGDLARETGIITLGALDADAQVYYQQTSVITTKADFTFLGPVNEALRIYTDASADNTPDDDFTTFLKLFVRKKGRTYAGSTIADIGVTTIGTIVNRFPLSHVIDAAITLTDANILGTNPYRFGAAPTAIITGSDGDTLAVDGVLFESTGSTFTTAGVIPGDILQITGGTAAVQGYYEITAVAATQLTIKEAESVSGNDFTFNTGFQADETGLAFSVFTSVLTPKAGLAAVRDAGTFNQVVADTGIVDVDGATGTITDTTGTFVTDDIATGDILVITKSWEQSFNSATAIATGTDLFTIANHNFRTGDRVIYDVTAGTIPVSTPQIVDGSVYYVSVASSSTFYLCTTLEAAWTRAYGDADQINFTAVGTGTHNLFMHEIDGCYPVVSRDSASILTIDTTDNAFPSTVKPNTTYYIVEPGMYLQYKDKSVDRFDGAQTTTPLTSLIVSGGDTITIVGPDFDYLDDTGATVQIAEGDVIEISGSTSATSTTADGRYTVAARTSPTVVTVKETILNGTYNSALSTTFVDVKQGFKRTIGTGDFAYNWKVSGNGAGLQDVFQFVQSELRSDADIDCGAGAFVDATNTGLIGFVGNINDLLMTFASPTGTGLNMFIDGLDSNDINNATFNDHTGTARNFPFTAAGSLVFNPNLTNDQNSKYWLFFTNDDAGDNLGRDYGTENAIIVEDATTPTANPIFGFVNASGGATHGGTRTVDSGTTSISFTYAYDTNTQRGGASAGLDAPVTLIAIGAPTAQFVIATGTITQATGITISAVAALERNYNGALTP
jgi:hypothetical protein